jgi:hypothetical protein
MAAVGGNVRGNAASVLAPNARSAGEPLHRAERGQRQRCLRRQSCDVLRGKEPALRYALHEIATANAKCVLAREHGSASVITNWRSIGTFSPKHRLGEMSTGVLGFEIPGNCLQF